MSEAPKIALKLQLITAQRKGEILAVEWSEVYLEASWWVIPESKSKNGVRHHVPLSETAMGLLYGLKKLNGRSKWLFPSDTSKSHMAGESIGKAVRRGHEAIFSEKGIKPFTPHDLRRTAATHMTEMGISRFVVSKILNHVDSTITVIYDRHSYDAEKRNALESCGMKLKEIVDSYASTQNIVDLEDKKR